MTRVDDAHAVVRTPNEDPPKARQRVWAGGALIVIAIAAFALFGTHPLVSAGGANQAVRADDVALEQVTDLRMTLANWQIFLEPHLATLSAAPSKINPTDVAQGSQLAQIEGTQAAALVANLRALGMSRTANDVEARSAAFVTSLAPLSPLAAGRSSGVIATAVNGERNAFARVRDSTTVAATQLRAASVDDLAKSSSDLDTARRTTLLTDAAAVAIAIAIALVFGRRAQHRENDELGERRRRAFETMMQHALEMSKAEPDVYVVLEEALRTSVPTLQVEMLVADSSRAHFHQTLTTAGPTTAPTDLEPDAVPTTRSGCSVVSPLDCPATRRGHTLVFPTSRALDACPYLKGRPSGDCSAVCVAISLTGKTVGVLHATGADNHVPTDRDVRYLEITSRRASERIAMLRAFEKSEAQARSDPLTGLWNRRSLENRVHELRRDGVPFALAYGDLDHFKALNDTHGHEAGDQALRLFSRVLRDTVRPHDIAARYGGEEFVIVLPDCSIATATGVLERLRERLALTLTTGRVPAFTVSFGLASSVDADTFDEVVAVADQALLSAKVAGRNRVVVADDPPHH